MSLKLPEPITVSKQSRKAINDLIKKEREAKKDEKLMSKLLIDKNPYFR